MHVRQCGVDPENAAAPRQLAANPLFLIAEHHRRRLAHSHWQSVLAVVVANRRTV